jgi:hypothetical protein
MARELQLIKELEYAPYFLTVHEMVLFTGRSLPGPRVIAASNPRQTEEIPLSDCRMTIIHARSPAALPTKAASDYGTAVSGQRRRRLKRSAYRLSADDQVQIVY